MVTTAIMAAVQRPIQQGDVHNGTDFIAASEFMFAHKYAHTRRCSNHVFESMRSV